MRKKYRPTQKIYDSNFEETFHQLWKAHSTYPIVHHHTVHLSRKWEIDFCFPTERIAIELQGYGTGHLSYKNMQRDYNKHNDLILAGWVLLYFMTADIKDEPERTISTIKRVIERVNPTIGKFDITSIERSEHQPGNLLEAARRLINKKTYRP